MATFTDEEKEALESIRFYFRKFKDRGFIRAEQVEFLLWGLRMAENPIEHCAPAWVKDWTLHKNGKKQKE